MFMEGKSIDEYVDVVVETVRKVQGKEITATGGTTEERATSLLSAFKAADLAEEVEP